MHITCSSKKRAQNLNHVCLFVVFSFTIFSSQMLGQVSITNGHDRAVYRNGLLFVAEAHNHGIQEGAAKSFAIDDVLRADIGVDTKDYLTLLEEARFLKANVTTMSLQSSVSSQSIVEASQSRLSRRLSPEGIVAWNKFLTTRISPATSTSYLLRHPR